MPKPKGQRTTKGYAVVFSAENGIIDRGVMQDNHKWWSPFLIFGTRAEAVRHRNEKWMGQTGKNPVIKVLPVTIVYKEFLKKSTK